MNKKEQREAINAFNEYHPEERLKKEAYKGLNKNFNGNNKRKRSKKRSH